MKAAIFLALQINKQKHRTLNMQKTHASARRSIFFFVKENLGTSNDYNRTCLEALKGYT